MRVSDERGKGLTLWMGDAFSVVQVFTGDTLQPARRRRALAVEPMTCAPDAFNNNDAGLVMLAPNARWSGVWGISPS